MTRVAGSQDPRQLEPNICAAIGAQRMLEFDYGGYRRVVQPYCHGFTRQGAETLRAVQVSSHGGSRGRAFGKLWTFAPDDPDYNPDDTALGELHCRVKAALRPNGSG